MIQHFKAELGPCDNLDNHRIGGTPTIAGGQGQRQPSQIELDGARFQGKLIAETANKIFGSQGNPAAQAKKPAPRLASTRDLNGRYAERYASRSKRSAFMTFVQAATKSCTNFFLLSFCAYTSA